MITDGNLLAATSLGFALGLRHALDPDHMVAVSTIVSEHKSVRRSSLVGACWGLGHSASLLGVGVAVIVLKLSISGHLARWMEFGVAVMLIFLGIKTVYKTLGIPRIHRHRHSHGGREHTHIHLHQPGEEHIHYHRHLPGVGAQPFCVGLVHGLAGSAGLMLLVLGTIPSAIAGLIYITMFGLGSVGGMLVMSSLISVPFVLSAKRSSLLRKRLRLAVGLSSAVFGFFLVWQQVFQERLFYR
jgi:ABC-type nickel/cobalt efflux system permease component RcnA